MNKFVIISFCLLLGCYKLPLYLRSEEEMFKAVKNISFHKYHNMTLHTFLKNENHLLKWGHHFTPPCDSCKFLYKIYFQDMAGEKYKYKELLIEIIADMRTQKDSLGNIFICDKSVSMDSFTRIRSVRLIETTDVRLIPKNAVTN